MATSVFCKCYEEEIKKTQEAARVKFEADVLEYQRPIEEIVEMVRLASYAEIAGKFGEYTLFMLCAAKQTETGLRVILELLARRHFPGKEEAINLSPAIFLCSYGYTDCLRFLLEHETDVNVDWCCADGYTAAMYACMYGSANCLKLLLERDASVNQCSNDEYSALMLACAFDDTDCVEHLLEHGADTNHSTSEGDTALIVASVASPPSCLRKLLEHGVFLDAQNTHGKTALMCACEYGLDDACRLLLDHGAAPLLKDTNGDTAFDYANHKHKPPCVSFFAILQPGVHCLALLNNAQEALQ